MKANPKNTKSKQENKKYYKCIRTSTCNSFTKGKIYSIINADDLEAEFNFIDNFYQPNGFGGVNHKYFKPSTLKAYLTQEEKLKEIIAKEKEIEEKTKKINNATAKGFSLNEQRKKQRENNPKVTVGFRCDLTTQKEILRLSKKAEIKTSEWISLVIEDAIKNKVEVSKVTVLSIKYNQ
jgi:hypothetical protein